MAEADNSFTYTAYYMQHIKNHGTNVWYPMGDQQPPNTDCVYYPFNPSACEWTSVGIWTTPTDTGYVTAGEGARVFSTSASPGQPGPFGDTAALNLGGVGLMGEWNCWQCTLDAWEWCGYWNPQNAGPQVLFTTQLQSSGAYAAGALYVSIGTVNNFVVGVANSSGADYGVANNAYDAGAAEFRWHWTCVGYSGGETGTYHTVGDGVGVQTFTGPRAVWGNGSNAQRWFANGNVQLYGYGFWNSATGGESTFTAPTCVSADCNGGTSGAGGGGAGTGCAQVGPISGQAKPQWCYPQLGCSQFDTGWNIGADIQWLACSVTQVVLTAVGDVTNGAIDLAVPANPTGPWSALFASMEQHVPFSYLVDGWNVVTGVFNEPATDPVWHAHLTLPYGAHTDFTVAPVAMLQPLVEPGLGGVTGRQFLAADMVIFFAVKMYAVTRSKISKVGGSTDFNDDIMSAVIR